MSNIKKIISKLLFVNTLFLLFVFSAFSEQLDYHKRPKELQEWIDKTFIELEGYTTSNWGLFNGKDHYAMVILMNLNL